ncbi:MAG: glycosyltransferase family 2 protein [Phycisphaerales bacterium]|nr:glycosyltransferase family 2 protein [Phycisphaerales bacterium]
MSDDAPKQLAVVVLNYKTPGLVLDCLASLRAEIEGNDAYEVIVVDNCSGDGSDAQIEEAINAQGWQDWARLVRSPVNGGFAAGNNIGIRATDAETIILLNSDTIVRSGAIAELMNTLNENAQLDMLSPMLEWPDGLHQISTFRYRTPITELISASKLGTIGRMLPKHLVARELREYTEGIDWVSFACVAIRRRVFDRVGLLDERYFMYFEDMAYCRNATKRGFTIGYQPGAHVVHLRGGSSPVKEQTIQRKRRPAYFYAARAHYFKSFYGFPGYLAANLFWLLGWILGSLRGRSGAVAGEYRDIWCSGKHTMSKEGAS